VLAGVPGRRKGRFQLTCVKVHHHQLVSAVQERLEVVLRGVACVRASVRERASAARVCWSLCAGLRAVHGRVLRQWPPNCRVCGCRSRPLSRLGTWRRPRSAPAALARRHTQLRLDTSPRTLFSSCSGGAPVLVLGAATVAVAVAAAAAASVAPRATASALRAGRWCSRGDDAAQLPASTRRLRRVGAALLTAGTLVMARQAPSSLAWRSILLRSVRGNHKRRSGSPAMLT
jgi:hypothetical protein